MRPPWRSPVVVLGEFDGGHVGHQVLIEAGRSIAEDLHRPLIAVVMDDPFGAPRLSSIGARCHWVLGQGVTAAVAIMASEGTSTAAMIAERVVSQLHPSCVVLACVPSDRLMSERPQLSAAFRQRGVEVGEVPRVMTRDGRPVTSQSVRDALKIGDLDSVHRLLRRRYSISGTVVRGNQLGRTIGFPTANVVPLEDGVLPPLGVYAGRVTLDDGRQFAAAVNLGVRPTVVAEGQIMLEAHLIGFEGDLYDSEIDIALYRRLRPERRFDSLDELTDQLARDVVEARAHMSDIGF